MTAPSDLNFEIGHVLFVDIVGYSKLLINEQTELLDHLKGMVRSSEQVRAAEAEGKLIRLATGDGMALVFRNSPEAPASCALELSRADKEHPELQLRMGIHSGPINVVTDVNDRANVTGAGINMAQRVMDCGDAGHILLSRHVAEDLEQYRRWHPLLHGLGECEVKHGVRLGIVNLYTHELGNSDLPARFKSVGVAAAPASTNVARKYWIVFSGVAVVVAITLVTFWFLRKHGTPALVTTPGESVAVLPFANEGGNKDEQYFADGLSEDLITTLTQFAGLKVINRDSSFRFRKSTESINTIADQLGVAHLLEGSVQRLGDKVRISAELVTAADGSTLWSEHYDRPYKDLFALQDDITKAVAGALKAKLLVATNSSAVEQSDRPPSGNLAAYDAFQRGQFNSQQGSQEGFRRAIEEFAEASRLDPNYAAAYAAAAETWVELAGYYFGDTDMSFAYAQAGIAANTAIRLNPDLAAAHLANSSVLVNADGDWNGWHAEARRALELAPRSAEARFQLSTAEAGLGHVQSAVELVTQALAVNALNGYWQSWFATYQSSLGHLDEAEVASHKAVELLPNRVMSQVTLTIVETLRGNSVAALAAARHTAPGINQDFAITFALQAGADPAAADAALKDLVAKHGHDSAYAYLIADVYALHRDADNTFQWLDKAWVNHRGVDIQYLLYDPFILRYKDDPRFAAFCHKIGLPTTTDAKAMP